MLCVPTKCRGGFTLLEVILAVAMVAMVTLTIFRFLQGNLSAIQISSQVAEQDRALEALFSVLESELLALSPPREGAFQGEPHKFGKYSSDELQWICGAGNGVFSNQAKGEYRVKLMLGKGGAGKQALGLSRVPVTSETKLANWLPLLPEVQELRLRYFDPRLNGWQDKWTDRNARPALVRVDLLRAGDGAHYQRILRVGPQTQAGP